MNSAKSSSNDLSVLLSVLQDDIRHVHVRVTAAIAIAAVFVTQIPLEDLRRQPDWARWLTVAGIALLFLAAVSFFQYTHELNKLRLRIVAEQVGPHIGGAAEVWTKWVKSSLKGDWRKGKIRWFQVGEGLLFAGLGCVGVVLVHLIL
jgi:uncharacterized protein involved in cysteine biosynthesis